MPRRNRKVRPSGGEQAAVLDTSDYRFTGGETMTETEELPVDRLLKVGSVLGQANLCCLGSGLRLAFRTSRRLAKGHLRLLSHVVSTGVSAESDKHILAVVVDEARGCLREVADSAAEEFGRLQRELHGLQDTARKIVAEQREEPRKHRRFYKVKS
jgi:hypothetical protein